MTGHVKPTLYSCKHCSGTTFCSASRDPTGKLKARPACVACLAKAGLDTKGVYGKVTCSVCRGKGMVRPAREPDETKPDKTKKNLNRIVLIAIPLLLLAAAFPALGLLSYYRQQRDYDNAATQPADDTGPVIDLPMATARDLVAIGMSQTDVKEALGEPNVIKPGTETSEAREVWVYSCKDGNLVVTFLKGVVSERRTAAMY